VQARPAADKVECDKQGEEGKMQETVQDEAARSIGSL